LSLLVVMCLTAYVTYYYTVSAIAAKPAETQGHNPARGAVEIVDDCDLTVMRENKYKYIKPILITEKYCESKELADLKGKLQEKILFLQSKKAVTRSSVYFKELQTNRWIEVNGAEVYYPGSMLKLTIMLNILKQAEINPLILDKMLLLKKNVDLGVVIDPTKKLVTGQMYSVKQLIEAMIIRSDNDATSLLMEITDYKVTERLYNDLGLPLDKIEDWFYTISASDFGKFYRILYDSSFLVRPLSELALNLLVKSEYREGLLKYLPANAQVAHKFGERFTESELVQFHESGIVFLDDRSYLIVVMTEGNQIDSLQTCVADLSKICYDYVAGSKK